jgi:hypothetical protein
MKTYTKLQILSRIAEAPGTLDILDFPENMRDDVRDLLWGRNRKTGRTNHRARYLEVCFGDTKLHLSRNGKHRYHALRNAAAKAAKKAVRS